MEQIRKTAELARVLAAVSQGAVIFSDCNYWERLPGMPRSERTRSTQLDTAANRLLLAGLIEVGAGPGDAVRITAEGEVQAARWATCRRSARTPARMARSTTAS